MMRLSLASRLRWVQCLIFALLFGLHCAAAPFQNLDFEEYDLGKRTLPGWHFFTPLQPNFISETNITLGTPPGFVDGPLANLVDVSLFPNVGLDGKYALEFVAPGPWTFSQRGDVPADAKFLRWVSIGRIPFGLMIDGQAVPVEDFWDLTVTRDYRAYAQADISAFAGKNVEIELFTDKGPPQFNAPGSPFFGIIDDIGFSTMAIPEPSTLALFGVGAVSLLTIGRRRRISQRKCLVRMG